MADRRVSVFITAQVDSYKRNLSEAAVTTDRFGRAVDDTKGPLTGLENNSKRSGSEIDKLSGRLRVLTDVALVLGPALIPLGAGGIAGIVAMTAQLGAMAGALGVTLLAVGGLGDGLKALDAYQLDPTTANLEKLNQAMDKLGPSGEEFVRFLDSLEPEFASLQMAARDGLFPGAEEGINSLLERLPELRELVRSTAETLGDLSADAGGALGGERFNAFFEYLRTDGIPILDETSRTLGYLAEAAANTLVAFSPLTRDFSGGLLDFAQGLAEASRDLESNAGFQEFLAYIETNGPQAMATLGAVANALLQVAEAAAPLGGPVLRIIESFANALAAVAGSDLGTPIFVAIGALVAYSRTAKLIEGSFTRLEAGAQKLGTSLSTPATKLESLGKSAAGIAAVGIAVGAIADGVARIDAGNLDRSLEALGNGNVTDNIDQIVTSFENLTASRNNVDLGEIVTAGGLFGDTSLDKYADNIKQVDEALAAMVESGDAERAAQVLQELQTQAAGQGVSPDQVAGFLTEYSTALENVAAEAENAQPPVRDFAGAMRDASSSAQEEASRLEEATQAMRDHRTEALRGLNAQLDYRQAILDANGALKENGKDFSTTTEAGIANRRVVYGLADAWNQQSDAAKNAKGALHDARQNFIETATQLGATAGQAKRLADRLFEIPPKRSTQIEMEVGGANAALDAVLGRMRQIKDKHVTVTVTQNNVRPQGGQVGTEEQTPSTGKPPPRRAPRMAGRTMGRGALDIGATDVYTSARGSAGAKADLYGSKADQGASHAGDSMWVAGNAAMSLKKRLELATQAVDDERSALEALTSQRDSFAASVGGAYSQSDPLSGSLADFDLGVAANTNDTNSAAAALAQAAANGLDGALYQALSSSGNLNLVQEFAGLSAGQIADRENAFGAQSAAQTGLGNQAADHEFAQAIRDQTTELQAAQKERKRLADKVADLDKRVEAGAERGTRAGMADRDRTTATQVRTGSGGNSSFVRGPRRR